MLHTKTIFSNLPTNHTLKTNLVFKHSKRKKSKQNWKKKDLSSILIIKKLGCSRTTNAVKTIAKWMNEKYPDITLLVEDSTLNDFEDLRMEDYRKDVHVDFIISFGGDGTLLHVNSMFPGEIPPVLSFHTGTVGFLMSFASMQDYETAITNTINGNVEISNRGRLLTKLLKFEDGVVVEKHSTVLNEIVLQRYHPKFANLIGYAISLNDKKLTTSYGDGLIVSTPTGSTAYSMSCGGSIVHPVVDCVLVTPIAPTSLSFRPLILPSELCITITLLEDQSAQLARDGRLDENVITEHDQLVITKAPHPIPIIHKKDPTSDWTKNINDLLHWNKGFKRIKD